MQEILFNNEIAKPLKYDVENPFKLTKRKLENNIRLEKV